MTTAKRLGIWMDHSAAHIMEFTTNPIETKTIESQPTHREEEYDVSESERVRDNKEQHQESAYYKKLADVIINYDSVVLFGPTRAKVELFNIMRADNHFQKVKIEVRQTDKMTGNQQHAFVADYFSK